MVNICTYDGYVSLTNICLKICRNGIIETTVIENEEMLKETLHDYFSLDIDISVISSRLFSANSSTA